MQIHLNLSTAHPSILHSILILLLMLHFLSNHYSKKLHAIPDPLLVSITSLWRFLYVWTRHCEVMEQHHELPYLNGGTKETFDRRRSGSCRVMRGL
jgi:hypothetical protein